MQTFPHTHSKFHRLLSPPLPPPPGLPPHPPYITFSPQFSNPHHHPSSKMLTLTRSLSFPSPTPSHHRRRHPTSPPITTFKPSRRPHPPMIIAHAPGARRLSPALMSIRAFHSLLAIVQAFILILLTTFVTRRGANAAAVERRAMAIRRLREDEEEAGEEAVVERGFELFGTARGDTLFTQFWRPVISPPRGVVVLLHGLNEHSSRYNRFARQLNAAGLKVYAMDWIGHGGSDGLHGYVPNLDFAVTDTKAFLKKVLAENPGLPCFCFGHSTGGAIVLKTVMDPRVASAVQGVMLTSPAVRIQPSHPLVAVFAPILSLLVPRYQLNDNGEGAPISRDPKAVTAKYSDPLVYTGSIRIRTGSEILRITSFLQQNLHRVTIPFLVLHGTADTVTDPEASRILHKQSFSTDKSLKLYDGFLHDLLFEPERDDVSRDIVDWLTSRLQ